MTDTLQTQLEARLADTSVTVERFCQLVGRLYATGSLYRPWSEEEGRLYDDASRIEPILADYFSLAGFRLTHDRDARILRLFPPGAAEGESEEGAQEVTKRLRARVSRELAAALLALRFLYGKAVQEGNVNAQDEVTVTIEEVAQAMAGTLGLQLPRSSAERQTLFIAIQRSILSLVSEGILESVLAVARRALSVCRAFATGLTLLILQWFTTIASCTCAQNCYRYATSERSAHAADAPCSHISC